jgi:hypothetical protein
VAREAGEKAESVIFGEGDVAWVTLPELMIREFAATPATNPPVRQHRSDAVLPPRESEGSF